MKKLGWHLFTFASAAAYALALYAAFTGNIAWLQQNALVDEVYRFALRHAYFFETVGVVAYAFILTGIAHVSASAFQNRMARSARTLSGIFSNAALLAAPAWLPIIAGLVRTVA